MLHHRRLMKIFGKHLRVEHCRGQEIFYCKILKKSGQASPVSLLRSAPQVNHQPPKIPALRTSGLARSFCRLPHNPRFLVFFCHTFCKRQKRRLHSNSHHRAALVPEKKQLKAIIHNM